MHQHLSETVCRLALKFLPQWCTPRNSRGSSIDQTSKKKATDMHSSSLNSWRKRILCFINAKEPTNNFNIWHYRRPKRRRRVISLGALWPQVVMEVLPAEIEAGKIWGGVVTWIQSPFQRATQPAPGIHYLCRSICVRMYTSTKYASKFKIRIFEKPFLSFFHSRLSSFTSSFYELGGRHHWSSSWWSR